MQLPQAKARKMLGNPPECFDRSSAVAGDSVMEEENQMEQSEGEEMFLKLRNEGCDQADKGNYSEALKLLSRAAYINPNDYALYEMLAQLYMAEDMLVGAIKAAERAVTLAPNWIEGLHTLARCQREIGEVELSYSTYCKALSIVEQSGGPIKDGAHSVSAVPVPQQTVFPGVPAAAAGVGDFFGDEGVPSMTIIGTDPSGADTTNNTYASIANSGLSNTEVVCSSRQPDGGNSHVLYKDLQQLQEECNEVSNLLQQLRTKQNAMLQDVRASQTADEEEVGICKYHLSSRAYLVDSSPMEVSSTHHAAAGCASQPDS